MARTRRDEVAFLTRATRVKPRRALPRGRISPRLHLPAYIHLLPVEPRKEPNFSYRLLRAIYPAFRVLFPNHVIRAGRFGLERWSMLPSGEPGEPGGIGFREPGDIRAMVESFQPPRRLIQ